MGFGKNLHELGKILMQDKSKIPRLLEELAEQANPEQILQGQNQRKSAYEKCLKIARVYSGRAKKARSDEEKKLYQDMAKNYRENADLRADIALIQWYRTCIEADSREASIRLKENLIN